MENKFEAGQIIFQCEPWIFTVNAEGAADFCHKCLLELCVADCTSGSISCPECGFAKYCSKICQADDWINQHQYECPSFTSLCQNGLLDLISTDALLTLKAIIRLQIPTGHQERCDITGRTFQPLVSHQENIEQDEELMDKLNLFYEVLILENTHIQSISFDTFVEIYGKLQCNAFGIVNSSFTTVGEGVYLGPSIMDHACDRNATYYFDGPRITVVALRPIRSLPEVRISYVDCFVPRSVRRQKLQERCKVRRTAYNVHRNHGLIGFTDYFTCDCRLCSDHSWAEQLAVLCGAPQCSRAVPLDGRAKSPCESCGQVNESTTHFLQAKEVIKELSLFHQRRLSADEDSNSNEEVQEPEVADVHQLLHEAVKYLHPQNILLGLTHELVARSFLDKATLKSKEKNSLEEALTHTLALLPPLRLFYTSFDIVIGTTLLTIGDLQHQLGKYDEAKASLKEAKDIFGLIDGRDRLLYKTAADLLESCSK